MNKKILAAAIAASFVAPMAVAADVTIFGKLQEEIVSNDISVNGAKTEDNFDVDSNASRWGIKGSEDLGNGMKANFFAEFQFNVDGDGVGIGTSTVNWAQRNTYIGLSGDFGEVRVGRHDTPAKVAMYASGIELLGDSTIDMNRSVTAEGDALFNEARVSNAIAYISPNMEGLQFAAAMVPGGQSGTTVTTGNDGIADTYSTGAWYGNGGLKLSAAYQSIAGATGTATADDQDMWGLYGSYTMGDFMVGAGYQDIDGYNNTVNTDKTSYLLVAKYSMGNNVLMANYGNAEIDRAGTVDDTESDKWGVALQHKFSSRTNVYVAYEDVSEDDTPAGTTIDSDLDRQVFALGLVHKF